MFGSSRGWFGLLADSCEQADTSGEAFQSAGQDRHRSLVRAILAQALRDPPAAAPQPADLDDDIDRRCDPLPDPQSARCLGAGAVAPPLALHLIAGWTVKTGAS
jgi:hypothetical protein